MTRTLGPVDVDSLRSSEFPLLEGAVYLNAASVAPLPERARAAVEAYHRRRGSVHLLENDDFAGPMHRLRDAAARLVNAGADEIAIGGNTSFGINVAALGLPLEPGTTILASEGEFPANVYPWMAQQARGVRFESVPADARGLPDEERMLERLDGGDVSVLALSSVQFGSGYRADVARFGAACRERGIFLVVDAIQSLGHSPVDVQAMGIDVLATGGHKWLCGPFGTGFAYVRRELHEVLEPRVIGWLAMQSCRDFDHLTDYEWEFVSGARRYEVGTLPIHDLLGLAHSIELLLEVGIEHIESHVLQWLDPLIEWLRERPAVEILSDLDPAHRSGILSFRTPDAKGVFEALGAAGVVCGYREHAIRVAPHLYNAGAEIGRLLEVLAEQEWS